MIREVMATMPNPRLILTGLFHDMEQEFTGARRCQTHSGLSIALLV